MKNNLRGIVRGGILWVMSLAFVSIVVTACSDDDSGFAGGSTEDAGIIADLNVAGVTQKGPFVKGAAVTVQGIDCKTLKFTDEVFEGKVKSDKGDFEIEDISLKSSCALFAVTGIYRSEITGKKTSKELTLYALTDLKNRKNVNINILTNLEYERLMYLVTEKGKTFAEAKAQAEKEVLAAFDIAGSFEEFENLNIFESGDENAALLAVSVMMQAETDDAGLAKRLDKFADSFAETGKWKDSTTKNAISEWAVKATASGELETIRKNVEAWNDGDKVAAFEKFIEAYADGDSVVLSSSSSKEPEPAEGSSSSSSDTPKSSDGETSASSSSAKTTAGSEYDATANTLKDLRDGKVYRTVKIGNQVWMAENLDFETEKSYCYNDSSKYCDKYGRLYTWAAAVDACPTGWHLPASAEFDTLFKAVGAQSVAGNRLKAATGWNTNLNLGDEYGFSALPAGNRYFDGTYNSEGTNADFWASTEEKGGSSAYAMYLNSDDGGAFLTAQSKNLGKSARCVKDDTTSSVSSSSGASSSSVRVNTDAGSEYNVAAGTLKDLRDGKTYKAVKIGKQTWMAENLNYETENSWCYNDSSKYCDKYGRLYTWAAAIDSIALANDRTNPQVCGNGKTCLFSKKLQGSCPSGWHLPSRAEWLTLFVAVGGKSVAGQKLMSKSDWEQGIGTDDYGFSALPAASAKLSLAYYINRPEQQPADGPLPAFQKHWSTDVVVFGGWKRRGAETALGSYTLSGTYGVVGVNVNPMYNLNHWLNVGASLDLYYDHSANLTAENPKAKAAGSESEQEGKDETETADVSSISPEDLLRTPSWYRQVTAGLSVRAEYVMPYFTVNFGIGHNFINAGSAHFKGFYEILALKAALSPKVFLHIGYSLYSFQYPNNLMLGVGYRFGVRRK